MYRLAIDCKGWRTGNAQLAGEIDILLHHFFHAPRINALIEFGRVQLQFRGISFEIVLAEGAAVFALSVIEQIIMIFPKLALFIGALAGCACLQRLLPQEGKMHIPETYDSCFDILLIKLTTRVSGKTPAEWSLEVAKFDHHNRRVE